MKIELITFDDLQGRSEIDLIGGIIEIPYADKVMRGKIDDIFWWKHGHLRGIDWTDATIWNGSFATWDPTGDSRIQFSFNQREYFAGPYEMESGEIFFISANLLYTAIFPVGHEPPDFPYDWRQCAHLHCRYMGIESVGRVS